MFALLHAERPRRSTRLLTFTTSALVLSLPLLTRAQQISPDRLPGLSWRLIGPFRGGRVTAVAGIAGDPKTYYLGTPNGGVWKTSSGGVDWTPIFDSAQVASIGDLVVAPSNPNIIYVATGEQSIGNGVWKSTDAGATWSHIGLGDSRRVPSLVVDPRDANIVYAAALGPLTPGAERGIYKSSDGGKTWRKTFFRDDHSSPSEICMDPNDSRTLYAVVRQIPPAPGQKPPEGTDTTLIKSTDSGETWSSLSDTGLPPTRRGRIGLAVAPGLGGKRVFALMNQGLFRSDDAGQSWQQITTDPRVLGSDYFGRAYSDPKNPDVVYVVQTSTYRSADGGRTFVAWKGTPSGEDDHVLWIAPEDTNRILMGTDQGGVITLDGGKTWNTWYNQPTGQFYRISTDQVFPYRLYASQQDSGSVSAPNRSDYGIITYRDWFPTGSFESGFIAADPLDPNFIYSVGWFGIVLRLDHATGQLATLFIPPANYRTARETPLLFSPRDPRTIYYGSQFVLKSADSGLTWKEISGDLTTKAAPSSESAKPPANGHVHTKDDFESDPLGDDEKAQQPQRGTIQTIAPSPLDSNLIWAGTTSGLAHVTHDSSTWTDVTPADLPERFNVNAIEASPHDPHVAFLAGFARRDAHPYIYRTRDSGKTWEKITAGLDDSAVAYVVREDPKRKGLLFAGTDNSLYVSFDSGDHWQSLQFNMPSTSVRDLVIHGSDLVAATFGRGLWIMDNISPLRELSAALQSAPVHLLSPEPALRVRWDNYPDTPLQPETPAAKNPPDGAILYYSLGSAPKGEVTLDVLDDHGAPVRHFSSTSSAETAPPPNVPEFWFSPPSSLPTTPGINRFVWDLRYPHPTALPYGYFGERLKYTEYTLPDHAIPGETPRFQLPGPLVIPGNYALVLTVEGKSYRQTLQLLPDPRVHITAADYTAQLNLSRKVCQLMEDTARAFAAVTALRAELDARKKALPTNPPKKLTDAVADVEKQLGSLEVGAGDTPGFGPLNRDMGRYLVMLQSGDIRPAESANAAVVASCRSHAKNQESWNALNATALLALNKLLADEKIQALPVAAPSVVANCNW